MRRSPIPAAIVAGAVAVLGAVAPTEARAETPELAPMERFASCVAGGGQGNVLLLIDTSGSLRDTDPSAGRVTAAVTTVQRMAESLATTPSIDATIAVAGFGTVFDKSLDWAPLTPGSLGPISADIATYSGLTNSVDTDYWSAMDGARREFAQRAEGQSNPCNLLLWFSDGDFHINTRANEAQMRERGGPKAWAPDNDLRNRAKTQEALDAGAADLCRPGGVADQVRSLDIITIGIGLAVDSPPGQFNLMKGIATGEACGEHVAPVPGDFVMATDIDELIYGFITALEPGQAAELPVCVQTVCAEGTRVFVLDGSIGAVAATAIAPVTDARVFLLTRAGDNVELTQGTGELDTSGANVSWQWASERVLTFDLERTDPTAWAGPWAIIFVSDEASDELARSSISLKGDISPAMLEAAPELRSGEAPAQLTFTVVDKAGQRIDPATLSEETLLNVELRTRDGSVRLAEGLVRSAMEAPVTLDLATLPPGPASVLLTLDVTTQSWSDGTTTVAGTRLEPRRSTIALRIAPPADFPVIASEVNFGSTETADPVTAILPLEGSGCAWLEDTTTFSGYPEGLGNARLSSPAASRDTCTPSQLELTLDPGGLGTGSFVGSTTVWLAPENSTAEPIAVDLAFSLDQRRPLSQPLLWGTFIAVVLLGVAIPVGILYAVKFLTAKIPGTALRAGTVSGPVTDSEAFTDGGVPLRMDQLALAHITNPRSVSVAGRTLRARMGAAPTEPGYVTVETPGPSAGGRGVLGQVRGGARLPLAVQGNWVVSLDPQRPHSGPVEVTVFTGPNAAGYAELLDDVRANLRAEVQKLRQSAPPEPPGAAAADPWGGSGVSNPSGGPVAPDPYGAPQSPAADPWLNPQSGHRPNNGPSTW